MLGTDTPSTEVFERVLNERESNDVAAISLTDPSLGNVSFNADYIDPSRDIVELPTGLVDASSLVASGCPSGAENRFTVAGRGGLPLHQQINSVLMPSSPIGQLCKHQKLKTVSQ